MSPDSTEKKVDKKQEELQTTVEAAQRQARLADESTTAEPLPKASHTLPDEEVSVLGGYPVPTHAEKDAQASDPKRQYFSGPGSDYDAVKPKAGETIDQDVWEAVYQNNSRRPTFILRAKAGTVFADPGRGSLRFDDF